MAPVLFRKLLSSFLSSISTQITVTLWSLFMHTSLFITVLLLCRPGSRCCRTGRGTLSRWERSTPPRAYLQLAKTFTKKATTIAENKKHMKNSQGCREAIRCSLQPQRGTANCPGACVDLHRGEAGRPRGTQADPRRTALRAGTPVRGALEA